MTDVLNSSKRLADIHYEAAVRQRFHELAGNAASRDYFGQLASRCKETLNPLDSTLDDLDTLLKAHPTNADGVEAVAMMERAKGDINERLYGSRAKPV